MSTSLADELKDPFYAQAVADALAALAAPLPEVHGSVPDVPNPLFGKVEGAPKAITGIFVPDDQVAYDAAHAQRADTIGKVVELATLVAKRSVYSQQNIEADKVIEYLELQNLWTTIQLVSTGAIAAETDAQRKAAHAFTSVLTRWPVIDIADAKLEAMFRERLVACVGTKLMDAADVEAILRLAVERPVYVWEAWLHREPDYGDVIAVLGKDHADLDVPMFSSGAPLNAAADSTIPAAQRPPVT